MGPVENKSTTFWDMTQCSLVDGNILEEAAASFFRIWQWRQRLKSQIQVPTYHLWICIRTWAPQIVSNLLQWTSQRLTASGGTYNVSKVHIYMTHGSQRKYCRSTEPHQQSQSSWKFKFIDWHHSLQQPSSPNWDQQWHPQKHIVDIQKKYSVKIYKSHAHTHKTT